MKTKDLNHFQAPKNQVKIPFPTQQSQIPLPHQQILQPMKVSFHSEMSLFQILLLCLTLGFASSVTIKNETSAHRNLATNPLCPWDIASIQKLITQNHLPFINQGISTQCQYVLQGIRLLRSDYLRTHGSFSLPPNVLEACWDSFENLVHQFIPGFQIRSSCGYNTNFISETCMNITSRSDFEKFVPAPQLQQINSSCDQSLATDSACASCVDSLNNVSSYYFKGSDDGNVSDCIGYPFIYAAAFANRFGPVDIGTAMCFFLLDFSSASQKSSKNPNAVMWGILSGCIDGFVGALVVVWCLWVWHKKWRKKRRDNLSRVEVLTDVESGSSSLKFSFEAIRKATDNFSLENIVGMGAYGNVYKGVLPDGSEVAMKRFKNCSAAGDQVFVHEVEVIASVRHVNLVALRGYCTATMLREGHQRIIACDLMRNGSLFQHLFQPGFKKLTWSIRQKIALGMAHGLAYLHYGIHPSIIHRDIKASNVLLDEAFEAKLADFGLAKFTPEGQTHMSTRVAGTLGYVAPEYALYGQLSERIDVYSFGVVLLELLSGKKAVVEILDDNRPLLLADWAWSQVREGAALGVIEEGMPELGVPEVMEKYVLVAVLCSHPIAYARPTMDHIVKILENNDTPVPSIQDRPFSLLAQMDDTERSRSQNNNCKYSIH